MTNYAFVLDADKNQLAPTKEQKAWFLIRKKRATLVSKYPMVIQLNKTVS
ncbi:RRXRR domain-containing protein [Eubacterium sp. MSJ-13]|nr:RRXRR domain-containing protein [Eubacterium sp. MSJ-13]